MPFGSEQEDHGTTLKRIPPPQYPGWNPPSPSPPSPSLKAKRLALSKSQPDLSKLGTLNDRSDNVPFRHTLGNTRCVNNFSDE